ncbi:MAG: class I SAM-dependent methyltransferase [Hyphomicrobium sp.]
MSSEFKRGPAGAAGPRAGGRLARLRDEALLSAACRTFERAGLSPIAVGLPSGTHRTLGSTNIGSGAATAHLHLKSFWPLWRSVRRGGLGFAESFMRGEIETDDLGDLIRYFLDNYETLVSSGRGRFEVSGSDRSWHQERDNTREGSRRNIAAHYDLGNAFYERWLDPGMTYSSALRQQEGQTLESAQEAKYALTLDALELKPGQRLLEIGCGWGGMAERAARAGSDVTAITVSNEQLAYTSQRLSAAGLGDAAEVRFQDYRDLAGTFDRLVSIEMIEAVGEAHWPTYFATIAERLKRGGTAVLQAITIREEDFALYRSRPDFIQRYIFPGGMLPTVTLMRQHAERVGLEFETVQRFGASYAWTLAEWRRRFRAAWPAIADLGFDERFRRMWEYYLIYCEVGFERGVCDVGTYRLHKRA